MNVNSRIIWWSSWAQAMFRAAAGLLGLVTLWNLLGFLRFGEDLNIWWVDLRPCPAGVRIGLETLFGLLLLSWGIRPVMSPRRRRLTIVLAAVMLIAVLVNAVVFFVLLVEGHIASGFAFPVSLLVAAELGGVLWFSMRSKADARSGGAWWQIALAGAVLSAAAPWVHMMCFGQTDYRRSADVAVVFGAGVYPDGTLSDALEDRMQTAVDLYRRGLVGTLLLSGGPGMGDVHETQAMRNFALSHGVDAGDILLDRLGLSTRHTACNSLALLESVGSERVLAVSHAYHLPRIKLAYQQLGRDVHTVPARETYVLSAMPYYMLRESVAWWAYYLGA